MSNKEPVWTGLVGGRNGKEGLVDHRFENALLEDQIRLLLYIGQFRVFLRTQAGDGKFRCTATDGGKKPFVGKDADRFSRNASDDVQQKVWQKEPVLPPALFWIQWW